MQFQSTAREPNCKDFFFFFKKKRFFKLKNDLIKISKVYLT